MILVTTCTGRGRSGRQTSAPHPRDSRRKIAHINITASASPATRQGLPEGSLGVPETHGFSSSLWNAPAVRAAGADRAACAWAIAVDPGVALPRCRQRAGAEYSRWLCFGHLRDAHHVARGVPERAVARTPGLVDGLLQHLGAEGPHPLEGRVDIVGAEHAH